MSGAADGIEFPMSATRPAHWLHRRVRAHEPKKNTMNIRAKMRVTEVTKMEYGAERVKLSAVYADKTNAEDNTYAKATPSASVEMQVDNEAAHGAFVPGKKYYVDFTPTE